MTPESLRDQIEQIRREALCAWDAYAQKENTNGADEINDRAALCWRVVVDETQPPINFGSALVCIEIPERKHNQPRHARRVRALLDQDARDREAGGL